MANSQTRRLQKIGVSIKVNKGASTDLRDYKNNDWPAISFVSFERSSQPSKRRQKWQPANKKKDRRGSE